jgi:hypothetical protein
MTLINIENKKQALYLENLSSIIKVRILKWQY